VVGAGAPEPLGTNPGASAPGSLARTISLLSYEVRVAPGVLLSVGEVVASRAPAHTIAVITDDQVGREFGARVVAALQAALPGARTIQRAIPHGEQFKTRETWAALTDWLLEERCGRDTSIVALGGGVVGDLAGFVAATYMRGVPFVQLPTSLLAMVDASVGGKVGVDTPAGKNLVGAFHQPQAVLIDPLALRSLPPSHRRAGMAEVLKHGIIADAPYLERAIRLGPTIVSASDDAVWRSPDLVELIARSVEIKAEVVRADERETGRRQVLNFGHTVGHAIEAASDFTMLHGDAIGIGMVVEACLAELLGVAEPGTSRAVHAAVEAVGLPTVVPAAMDRTGLVARMAGDKKARRGQVVMALPARIGAMSGGEVLSQTSPI
jgi:3-dehydroquinate synthase